MIRGFAAPARYNPRSPGLLQRPASGRFRERTIQLRQMCRLRQSLPFVCWADASARLLPVLSGRHRSESAFCRRSPKPVYVFRRKEVQKSILAQKTVWKRKTAAGSHEPAATAVFLIYVHLNCCAKLPEHGEELPLSQNRNTKFLGLFQFGSGGLAGHHIAGLFGH